jgi:hypothetical protein
MMVSIGFSVSSCLFLSLTRLSFGFFANLHVVLVSSQQRWVCQDLYDPIITLSN